MRNKFQQDCRQTLCNGTGGVLLSQEKLEDEKSISFFKDKRTPFKGKLIEGGGGDVENLFRFSKFLVRIFLFLSPLRTFLYSRAARVIPKISHSIQRTSTLILEN